MSHKEEMPYVSVGCRVTCSAVRELVSRVHIGQDLSWRKTSKRSGSVSGAPPVEQGQSSVNMVKFSVSAELGMPAHLFFVERDSAAFRSLVAKVYQISSYSVGRRSLLLLQPTGRGRPDLGFCGR